MSTRFARARRLGGAWLVVVVIASSFIAAGCGGSGNDSTGASTASAAKPTGPPINIMGIDAYTIPTLGYEADADEAAKARAASVNAAGGIDGRPLNLILCDTEGDGNKAADCARQAVAKKVVAVVGLLAGGQDPAYSILQAAKIPVVGNSASGRVPATSPISFAFTSDPTLIASAAGLFQRAGIRNIGAILPQYPAAPIDEMALRQTASHLGVKVGNVVQAPYRTTDFSPFVAKALAGGARGVFTFFPGPNQVTVIKAINQFNPDVKIGALSVTLTPDQLDALGPIADGLFLVAVARPLSSPTPGGKLFKADVDRFEHGSTSTDGALQQWASVWLLERIMKGMSTIDATTVAAKLGALQGFSLGGLFPPLTTSKPGPVPSAPRVFMTATVPAQLKDGELKELDPSHPFFDAFAGPPPRK